jgi:hypothetical protein
MDRETHIEFLSNLSDTNLRNHLRAYIRNGMDAQAARADAEWRNRKGWD